MYMQSYESNAYVLPTSKMNFILYVLKEEGNSNKNGFCLLEQKFIIT